MSDYDPDEATARQDLCRFLSACYYEPAPEFAEEHLFDSMLTAATCLHPDLVAHARKLGEAFAAQDLETLLVDYTRLFLGPIDTLASPYGSRSGTDHAAVVLGDDDGGRARERLPAP
jgi:TorA maturation chaperone TorD